MFEHRLHYPVHTLDGYEILPAGAIMNKETLNSLASVHNKAGTETKFIKLTEFGSLKKDLREFLSWSPYRVIFAGEDDEIAIQEIIDNVKLAVPVLESLKYFKGKDFYTYRHMLLVFALSILLNQVLTGDMKTLMRSVTASPSHDFGKICVPLNILKKRKPLTIHEKDLLKHHSLAGYVLLEYYNSGSGQLSSIVARDHHERKDGSGYPSGMQLTDPMVEIVVVCDIYDALISPRPYRPHSYGNRSALEEVSMMAEKGELNWDIVKALVACNRRDKPHYTECIIADERREPPPSGNLYGVVVPEEEG